VTFSYRSSLNPSQTSNNHNRITRSTTRTDEMTLAQIFCEKIIKFLEKITSNIAARFESNVLKFLNCFRMFHVPEVIKEQQFSIEKINMIKKQYPNDFNDDFKNNMLQISKLSNTLQHKSCLMVIYYSHKTLFDEHFERKMECLPKNIALSLFCDLLA
jgi:hypothetical protein